MIVKALNGDGKVIPLHQFFCEKEFEENKMLAMQTSRYLKSICRNPDTVKYLSDKKDDIFYFSVNGKRKKYTIGFKLENESLVLISLL